MLASIGEKKLPPRLKAAMKMNVMNRHWSDSCLHLATLGSHHIQLEIWLDPETASIIVRYVLPLKKIMCASLCHNKVQNLDTDWWGTLGGQRRYWQRGACPICWLGKSGSTWPCPIWNNIAHLRLL